MRSATSCAAVSGVVVMPSVARHRCGRVARSSRPPATPFPRYARDDSGSRFVILLLDLLQKRSATSCAAVSGVVVMPSVARHRCGRVARSSRPPATPFPRYARDDSGSRFVLLLLDLLQKRLDASRARARLVITKFEVRSNAQSNSLSEKMAHAAALRVEIACDPFRLVRIQTADEHTRKAQIGRHFNIGDRNHRQAAVFEIVTKDFDQRLAHGLANSRSALGFSHCRARITSQRSLLFFLIAETPLALSTSGHQGSSVVMVQCDIASRGTPGGAGTSSFRRS